ncbi:MAG: acetyl-CoA decarbonylase/synthase complex subunit delta [Dehalococcoidia bacterium]|nr:acetyl-CoA decarbonylase/synthase complex subunit delta [Dehalococcoidia bacterium]MDH4366959.1 acetyl-CoA decarbonylase/synthase complex subunit delta [Dehalococcoidia bacterium]
MDYKAPVEAYTGVVREVAIGKGNKSLKIGGENILPLHFFDQGSNPNPVKFALEVLDMKPEDWPEHAVEPFKDVIANSVSWAKKCQGAGVDAVSLFLMSTDPAVKDAPADKAATLAKEVAEAIAVPLIVYGSGDEKKDVEVLSKVAEVCDGMNLLIGPVLKENYEAVGKAILNHGHTAIAQSPLDINLLKELNVKLSKIFPPDRIVIDPLSSALGYGMEYSFSLIERVKQIGIMTKDSMTMMPIIANLGGECWKTKQAKENKKQGLLWEGVTALSLLLAGANIIVLRHPETLKLIKETIEAR